MSKTSYYNFRLAQLFPPKDDYAATVARLCILWEDFVTEATGGAAQHIKEMDGHSAQWRRLYFLRRSIGTIQEIRQALHHLQTQNEFKESLSKQPLPDQERFKASYKELIKNEDLIKDLRNGIAGGHVLQKAVKDGLDTMNPEMLGMLQEGAYYKTIRFKFSHPLVLRIMFPHHEQIDAEDQLDRFLKVLEEASSGVLPMIEFVFSIYVKERRITPL